MACFYRTASFLSQLQVTPSLNQKKDMVQVFRDGLNEVEKTNFDWLMNFVVTKGKVGLSSKLVNKYYLTKLVPPLQQPSLEPLLAEGRLPEIVGGGNGESELTLYDMKVFLTFLAETVGAGSQTVKT